MKLRSNSVFNSFFASLRLCVTLLFFSSLSAADDKPEPKGERITYRVVGLFAPDREKDLRAGFEELPEFKLVAVNFDDAEITIEFSPAKLAPGQKPERVAELVSDKVRAATSHTFSIKPRRTVARDKLERVAIPVFGHDCKACALAAYEAVAAIDGVEQATASFKDGTVTALIDPTKADRAKLEDALRKKGVALIGAPPPAPAQPIKHGFLATGGETFIVDEAGKQTWTYPHGSRDGWVLENGNVLLALSKSQKYSGGAAVEVDRDGKTVFEFKGTQAEVNTVQPLADGVVLLTEAGEKPRIFEVNREGKVVAEVPLQAQTKDTHLQTRMTRKLANGHYLVPQLLDRVVREYDAKGKVVWEAKTPHMPFTAIRLPDGNTLIGCTLGNTVIEVDKDGKEVWRVTNDDLPGKPINDACGVHRLANGNTVITSHHATAGQTKLTEVTRDKKVVWTYTDDRKGGIHHFQILDAKSKPEKNPLR